MLKELLAHLKSHRLIKGGRRHRLQTEKQPPLLNLERLLNNCYGRSTQTLCQHWVRLDQRHRPHNAARSALWSLCELCCNVRKGCFAILKLKIQLTSQPLVFQAYKTIDDPV